MSKQNAKIETKENKQNSKPNLIPVRGKNGSLVVRGISFSSSIGIDKLMSPCPRRNEEKRHLFVESET